MQYGMTWHGTDVARDAETAGISAFCSGEFADAEAFSSLAEMVGGTEHALVGPAIAYAFARTPFAHASAMRQMTKRAPGRLFLGLGSGAFTINRDWFGVPADRPVDRMADCVGAVKAWLHAENGEPVVYDGEFYSINAKVQAPVLGRLDVPVLVAGFNKRMAAVAGSAGDGIIGHGLFTATWWRDVVRPAFEGAGGGTEHGWVITAIDDTDPARAIRDAKRMIAFYLTVKTYDDYVTHHGWQEPVELLRSDLRRGDTDAMAERITDDMLHAIAICGTTDDGHSMLKAREGSLPRDVAFLAPPSFLVSDRRRAAYARSSLALLD